MTTPQQYKMYQFIANYWNKHHYAPTLKEIAEGMGLSPRSKSLISRQLRALEKLGWIRFFKKGYRNIQLLKPLKIHTQYSLPLLGQIAAGQPREAITDSQTLDLSAYFQGGNHFVLQVKGDSMIEAGILSNDFVICQKAQQAREGEIAVVLIDQQEATLKKISYKKRGKITLIPANSSMQSQVYAPERVQIQGIFTGLIRLKK